MPNVKLIGSSGIDTGGTVYAIIRRNADNFFLDDSDGSFKSSPVDVYLSLTENLVIKSLYEAPESRTVWDNGVYGVFIYNQAGGSPAPVSDDLRAGGNLIIENDEEIYSSSFSVSDINSAVLTTIPDLINRNNKLLKLISDDTDKILSLKERDSGRFQTQRRKS